MQISAQFALRSVTCYASVMVKKTQCPECREMSYSPTFGCVPCRREVVTVCNEPVVTEGANEGDAAVTSNEDVTRHCETCRCVPRTNAERQRAYRERKRNA